MLTTFIKHGVVKSEVLWSALWIHICFNTDPDPAFYLDANPDPGRETNAELLMHPDPGHT
jgi:hypothetical protein